MNEKPTQAGADETPRKKRGKQAGDYAIADLCRELALLLHAGSGVADGLALLAEESPQADRKAHLNALADQMDEGAPLSKALEQSGRYPAYVTGLIAVGEESGQLEDALSALADYYDQRGQREDRIRRALAYPSLLLVLMLIVIVVLLAKVLPVFDQVYASLGGSLTGVGGLLLQAGKGLNAAMPVLCVLLAAALVFLAVFFGCDGVRARLQTWWRRGHGDKGVSRKLNDARFAQALAMGLQSGLPLEEALQLVEELTDVPAAAARCRACCDRLEQGEELTQALRGADLLPASACHLLSLGIRSGSADTVMADIAARLSREADDALERQTARVEPILVLATSILVGAILLSVMLPLTHIMAAIG